MPGENWAGYILPGTLPMHLGVWLTDDPYIQCGLCGKVIAGAADGDDIEFATLDELLTLVTDHARAHHDG